jgi:hypothetical protein
VINLDTHILVFALASRIDERERSLLAGQTWGVSAIVFWELAKLVQLGRIQMDLEDAEVVRALSALRVWPIDLGSKPGEHAPGLQERPGRRADSRHQYRARGSALDPGPEDPRFPDRAVCLTGRFARRNGGCAPRIGYAKRKAPYSAGE